MPAIARSCCWTMLWCMQMIAVKGGILGTPKAEDRPSCQPGYYCPHDSGTPVPCPRGTYGPLAGATSVKSCVSCLPHFFSPRPGLAACLPCGHQAQQPLPGQDHCVCQGEGQSFQPSDGKCVCTLGYTPWGESGMCVPTIYKICRDRRTRGQSGECLSTEEWGEHCSQQVCLSPEDSEGYDVELGLCLCRSHTGVESCGGWCRAVYPRSPPMVRLVCIGSLWLLYGTSGDQVGVSSSLLSSLLKPWDSQGTLQCGSRAKFSNRVFLVQATVVGFMGLLSPALADLQRWFQEKGENLSRSPTLPDSQEGYGGIDVQDGQIWGRVATPGGGAGNSSGMGLINPTVCLHVRDILLFSITGEHYPQYDKENLYNTNAGFDWGPFRSLAFDASVRGTTPGLFCVVFHEPGVYALSLSSNPHKQMFVKVMPPGGQCYDAGTFYPTVPHYMIRMGITKKRHLLLHPDWGVIGGLLAGGVVILGACITVLVLLQDYGWSEKEPIPVQYRMLQLRYTMDDYASKGSSVMAVKKTHRTLQAGKPEATPLSEDEFWDYEHQVDLEAFSTPMFFEVLLKHSVSVTAQLSQLRSEVKELYQAVQEQFLGLPLEKTAAVGAVPQGYEMLRAQVQQEQVRRKALTTQFGQLLDSQLRILRVETSVQQQVHGTFGAWLKEALRLLDHVPAEPSQFDDQAPQHLILETALDRVANLVTQITGLVSRECQRQGAWAITGEPMGAKLLCPIRGVALGREEIIAMDGTILAHDAVAVDPSTGLIIPKPGTCMRLASGHTMPVPPDFFLHPQTGRVLPVAGNVAYDTTSGTLMVTVDTCAGEPGRFDTPLLPFVPYPRSSHRDGPIPCRLSRLLPGQRIVLGGSMRDTQTGIPVPILAVTIHPDSGLVYPLGGLYMCPLTQLPRPIQMGSPMQDPNGAGVALVTGVHLSPLTAEVLPMGGLLLGESFVEPLSGREARISGTSVRGGKLVPHAGGYQALLDTHVLAARIRVAELLHETAKIVGGQGWCGQDQLDRIRGAAMAVEKAWKRSQNCLLQLVCRLEILQDWAWQTAKDGGSQGEIQFPGTNFHLPALLGLEYPDPGGSGMQVPVLGSQMDWASGRLVSLAGTMEDADGKGLVPIRIGARTVDPVTGIVGPVVGARVDQFRKIVVPVIAREDQAEGEATDTGLMEVLQRECSLRSMFWRQQRQKEEELLKKLDRVLYHCLQSIVHTAIQGSAEQVQDSPPQHVQVHWKAKEGQLRAAAEVLAQEAQAETQRRQRVHSHLSLLLPPHVLLILTGGDEEHHEQQTWWQAELMAGLDRVSVGTDRLQQEQDRCITMPLQDCALRLRELWEQLNSRLAELEAALTRQYCLREHCQLRMDAAQAFLLGTFWYHDFGLTQLSSHIKIKRGGAVVLPLLQKLLRLAEEQKQDKYRRPTISTRNLVGAVKTQEPEQVSAATLDSWAGPSNVLQEKDPLPLKESTHICIPALAGQGWDQLLPLSPLFQQLRWVEEQLKYRARNGGLLGEHLPDKGCPFVDVLDAQWECEGELVPLNPDSLSLREFLVYQHGLFLLRTLQAQAEIPAVTLQLASSLPFNNYHHNAFRNSFFYQESEKNLFVRRQRLWTEGGFSLLLLHCVSHIAVGNMCVDSTDFKRVFFRVLQVCLSEYFLTRLGTPLDLRAEALRNAGQGELNVDQCTQSALWPLLVERIQRPAHGHPLSNDEVLKQLKRHRETSGLWHLENLLKETRSEVRKGWNKPSP